VEFQAKRIKFSLKRSSRERLFAQFQEANDRMRNLLESSDQIKASRMKEQMPMPLSIMNRKLIDFWRHAKRLHEALSNAWQCGCSSHEAGLQLLHRTSDKPEFDVMLKVGSDASQSFWASTSIKMTEASSSTPSVGVKINVQPSTSAHVR
jgi:hypothetical protein